MEKKNTVLLMLLFKYPNLLLTGSYGLKLLGITDREPNDLDLQCDSETLLKIIKNEEASISNEQGSEMEVEESEKDYIRLKIADVFCCVFLSKEDAKIYKTEKINGFDAKLSDPKLSIDAKKQYVAQFLNSTNPTEYAFKKTSQHLEDIFKYSQWDSKRNKMLTAL